MMTVPMNCNCPNCSLRIAFVGDVVVKPGFMFGPRRIAEYELVYFPAGSQTTYFVNQDSYRLSSPGYIITRPGEDHGYQFDATAPVRHLFIHFVLEFPDSEPVESELPFLHSANWIPSDSPLVPTLLKKIVQLAYERPFSWRDRCNQMLCVILTELNELHLDTNETHAPGSLPSQIVSAMHMIESELHTQIQVSQIAKRVGWTHSHFTRMMKEYLGVSPSLFVMSCRIERACQMLIYESKSIKEIAYETGFKDEHYFSRCFRRMKGVAASEFRRTYTDPRIDYLSPSVTQDWGYPLNKWFHFSE